MLAYDDTIRVEHGDDLEDESVSESSGSVSVTSQVLDHSAHHPGAGGLTRVNSDNHIKYHNEDNLGSDSSPGTQHDADLTLHLLQTVWSGDGEQMNIVTRQSPAQQSLRTKLRPLRVTLDAEQVLGQIRVSEIQKMFSPVLHTYPLPVWITVSKIHSVPSMWERDCKC